MHTHTLTHKPFRQANQPSNRRTSKRMSIVRLVICVCVWECDFNLLFDSHSLIFYFERNKLNKSLTFFLFHFAHHEIQTFLLTKKLSKTVVLTLTPAPNCCCCCYCWSNFSLSKHFRRYQVIYKDWMEVMAHREENEMKWKFKRQIRLI